MPSVHSLRQQRPKTQPMPEDVKIGNEYARKVMMQAGLDGTQLTAEGRAPTCPRRCLVLQATMSTTLPNGEKTVYKLFFNCDFLIFSFKLLR